MKGSFFLVTVVILGIVLIVSANLLTTQGGAIFRSSNSYNDNSNKGIDTGLEKSATINLLSSPSSRRSEEKNNNDDCKKKTRNNHEEVDDEEVTMMMRRPCKVTFVRYEQSDLEKFWAGNIRGLQGSVCETWRKQEAEIWMNGTMSIRANPALVNDPQALDRRVFSRFYHSLQCPGDEEPREVLTWIEPLAGLNRDPFAVCFHQTWEALLNANFIIPDVGIIPMSGTRRRFIYDLGASYWDKNPNNAGMHWLWNTYNLDKVGVERYIAWEIQFFEPYRIYGQMPFEMLSKLSYFPQAANPTDQRFNALEYIKFLTKKGDHIVFKLDIDNSKVEMMFMDEIRKSKINLVHEMFMEHHVNVKEMRQFWGKDARDTLESTYRMFSELRNRGIRMHSWP